MGSKSIKNNKQGVIMNKFDEKYQELLYNEEQKKKYFFSNDDEVGSVIAELYKTDEDSKRPYVALCGNMKINFQHIKEFDRSLVNKLFGE